MTVFINILQRIFKKWGNVLMMLILPTLICFGVLYISFAEGKLKVGVIDKDQTFLTRCFSEYMSDEYNLRMLGDVDISEQLLNEGYACIIVFDKGCTDTLGTENAVKVKSYYSDKASYIAPVTVKMEAFLDAAVYLKEASGKDAAEFEANLSEYMNRGEILNYLYAGAGDIKSREASSKALGYIAFCLIILMASSTSLVIEDRRSGVLRRLWCTPLKRASYYAQHILAYLTISIIQLVVILNILPLIMDVDFGNTLKTKTMILLICVCFSLTCISIGVAINKYAKNKMTVSSLNALVTLPMMMLGGCFWPRSIMPDTLQKIGEIMPTTWFLKLVDNVVYKGNLSGVEHYVVFLVLLAAALLFLTFVPGKQFDQI